MAVARRLIGYGKSDTLFLFTLDGQRFYFFIEQRKVKLRY